MLLRCDTIEHVVTKHATAEEVRSIIALWAATEGWNPGLHDAEIFFATDETGFFITYVNNKPAAAVSAVNYYTTKDGGVSNRNSTKHSSLNAAFAFIGLYICSPEYRGKGYGIKTFQTALSSLRSQPTVGLYGVLDQEANYVKSGFTTHNQVARFACVARLENERSKERTVNRSVIDARTVSFESLCEYDSVHFGARRDRFLATWLAAPGTVSLVYIDGQGVIQGFGSLRPATDSFRLGPLFARDDSVAGELFEVLMRHAPNAAVHIDIYDLNLSFVARPRLVETFEFKKLFSCVQMFTNGLPANVPWNEVFAVTTLELG